MLKGICTTVAAPLLSVVTGTVQDASTGEAVIGAAVILQNTTYGAVADADGRFVINNVKPGTYTIEVQMLSYQRVVIEGCQIKPGENTLPLISLQPSAEEIDEVVVTTVRRLSSEAAVMQAVRNSKMVVSGVSKQMIARTQDRDAGEVVRRIPGISIIDDKFIVARGLSQRYNNVWVNDAAIPSSEADSRAFSFDLIPAGQIENIMILKSPVPEIPADFTGRVRQDQHQRYAGRTTLRPLLLDRVQHGDLRSRLSLQSGKRQRLVRLRQRQARRAGWYYGCFR